ncbi:MAG: uncharacterized protein QOD93_1858 [Acetobacteraceae bacterium]|jgi:uncharacterized OB-fold protein|nr:uncharacterized protein [Acetobacteraceae bacterium]
MAYVARKIPFVGTPETNPETKPFFDGASAGKLMLARCKDTGKFFWYPRGISPFTLGPVEWAEASGKGKIYTFSVMERANPPYAIGYVTLAEGPSVLTNFVDCDFKALKIGQDVTVKFIKTEGEGPTLPFFTPA